MSPQLSSLRTNRQSSLISDDRALLQTLLLFHYIPLHTPGTKKKRKKSKYRDSTDAPDISPAEDPKAALNTLMDRLSIWSALADMSLEPSVKGKEKDEDGWSGVLKRFWTEIVVPSYVSLPLRCL